MSSDRRSFYVFQNILRGLLDFLNQITVFRYHGFLSNINLVIF